MPLDGQLLPKAPSARTLRQICGLSTHSSVFPKGTSQWARFRRQTTLDAALDLGGVMIRRDVRWAEVERVPGVFDFSGYDEIFAEAQARGVRVLGMLGYGNTWATTAVGANEYFPPDDPADFGRFAGAVASHYAGQMVGWEIWNEPNAGFRFWQGTDISGDPYAYADLLVAAGTAIHQADATTPVLLGGTVFTPQFIEGALPWLDGAWRHAPALDQAFDVAGIHTYQSYPPTVAPEIGHGNGVAEDPPLADKVAAHNCLLDHHSAADKPIWITELGWPVYENVDEAEQARWMVRGTLLAFAAGVEGVFWYTLRDGPDPLSYPPEDAFGLQHNDINENAMIDATPKPVYHALKGMLSVAGDARVVDQPPPWDGAPAGVYSVVMGTGASATVVAAWTVSGSVPVALNRAVDGFAQDATPTRSYASGEQVMLTPDVTYLQLP